MEVGRSVLYTWEYGREGSKDGWNLRGASETAAYLEEVVGKYGQRLILRWPFFVLGLPAYYPY